MTSRLAHSRFRMNQHGHSVVLVGFQDQGNLGLGYLAAVLERRGYRVRVMDIGRPPEHLLRCIRSEDPVLVGFSIIFQYYLPKIGELASFLASRGVKCHLTAGGHFPSLRYAQTLQEIPELDSIVLFEGEYTLSALVDSLASGRDWRRIPGLAYRQDGQVARGVLRPLVADLDRLPFPQRPDMQRAILGCRYQPILATRGCPRDCAFCSIREFYGRARGRRVRRRSPANVVQEMADLYDEHGVKIFLFQDDDFPLIGKAGRAWTRRFLDELDSHGLAGNVIWKISCRADEVDADLFSTLQEYGLYLVYLGIESGTEDGLRRLNKGTTVADNIRAVGVLKNLGLRFGYGFMMFEPGSTFGSVSANVGFLRAIVGDGSAAVSFCKMLPYAGTRVERELEAAGRLRGTVASPDYRFIDPAMDEYCEKLDRALRSWMHGKDGVANCLNLALHEVAVIRQLFPALAKTDEYEEFLVAKTKQANERVLSAVEDSASALRAGRAFPVSATEMEAEATALLRNLLHRRDEFVYRNQASMLDFLRIKPAA
jgi:anaerobic magnesium-protoporphyrin IX monomethyl ester cyclase